LFTNNKNWKISISINNFVSFQFQLTKRVRFPVSSVPICTFSLCRFGGESALAAADLTLVVEPDLTPEAVRDKFSFESFLRTVAGSAAGATSRVAGAGGIAAPDS
jgi:hypothetical protein